MGSSESATEQPMIVMGKVRRSYRGPARRKIVAVAIRELTVARGSGLLLIGPNGSGKTTLLHLLSGLLRPDLGTVVVDGCDLTKLKEAKLDRFRARKIGYLLQNAQLLEGFTAEENIMAALLFAGHRPKAQRRRCTELLKQFDIAHRARHRPAAMSGGERQRVALARALANDPALVLADEPTASLDRPAADRLVEQLKQLSTTENRTLIIATHQPELFPTHFDVLDMGKKELEWEQTR